jgi:hypothetical protein
MDNGQRGKPGSSSLSIAIDGARVDAEQTTVD